MKTKKFNEQLDKLSILAYNKTGYSIPSMVVTLINDVELRNKYELDYFILNSIEWQIFIELIQEAINN